MTKQSPYRKSLIDARMERLRREAAEAPRAKLCSCDEPWAYRDELELRCLRCGRSITPGKSETRRCAVCSEQKATEGIHCRRCARSLEQDRLERKSGR